MSALTGQAWLIQALSADPVLETLGVTGVYAGNAPLDAVYPFLEARFVVGNPLANNSNSLIWFDEIYDVKAIDEGESWARIAPIANRILATLNNRYDEVPGVGGGVMIGCSVTGKIQYNEVDEEKQFLHLGYSFRVYSK